MNSLAKTLHHKLLRLRNARTRRHKLSTAGRRVFVDCGANTCTVLRSFIATFPDFEFFAFEPQPELRQQGQALARAHPMVHFFDKAVWVDNTELNFYLARRWGDNYRGGSTLLHGHTANESAVDYGRPLRVQAIDFSEWLRCNVALDDYVIVKMDIEGAEYDVLEKVIADGALPLIDELIIEFHQHMNPRISAARHQSLIATLRQSVYLEMWH